MRANNLYLAVTLVSFLRVGRLLEAGQSPGSSPSQAAAGPAAPQMPEKDTQGDTVSACPMDKIHTLTPARKGHPPGFERQTFPPTAYI